MLQRAWLARARPHVALQVRCMARIWRPHIDDVDRLSRGDGARTKGTGCTVIPHRLNAEEAAKYEAAKKKVRAVAGVARPWQAHSMQAGLPTSAGARLQLAAAPAATPRPPPPPKRRDTWRCAARASGAAARAGR
jgi:hypothetical protein